ncbi:unnamed protein product [Chrysoparadoxa australica]
MSPCRKATLLLGLLIACGRAGAFFNPVDPVTTRGTCQGRGRAFPSNAVVAVKGQAVATAAASTDLVTKYKKLQNQSDIRGVSMPGVVDEPVTLDIEQAHCIGAAFARWLKNQGSSQPMTIGVGRDCRLSGGALSAALMEGITSEGLAVVDVGMATTPAMFKGCITEGFDFDGSIMVTASHLPSNRNGFKLFTPAGGLGKPDVAWLVAEAAQVHAQDRSFTSPPADLYKAVPILPVYQQLLQDMIREDVGKAGDDYLLPLKGLKIVVNAGNGMGGFVADLLASLGADTSGSLFLEPDGSFPNHLANPELPEAMEPTCKVTKLYDLPGIVLDTDVDRSGVVDSDGKIINRNRHDYVLIALMAVIILRDYPGATIVTDSTTSNGIKSFIGERGGQHVRYKKGYKNVIDKADELNKEGTDARLAIETSGHGAFKDNDMLDDGAYMAMKIVVEMAKLGKDQHISELIEELQEPTEEVEIRLKVKPSYETEDIYEEALASLGAAVTRVDEWELEQENWEGLRVNIAEGDDRSGWLMARMSLHDPIVIFNVESEVKGGLASVAQKLLDEVITPMNGAEKMDLTALTKHL